jgi:hypothetical protein
MSPRGLHEYSRNLNSPITMSTNNISLDGGEISVLKALGFGGSAISGDQMLERVPDMVFAELGDALQGLVAMGYVDADRTSFHTEEDFKKTFFHVNTGYSRDLKDALDPQPQPKKSRRVRRE